MGLNVASMQATDKRTAVLPLLSRCCELPHPVPTTRHTTAQRNHLIVAFSDQMAAPQTQFFGTAAAAKRAGRKYANQHLKRAKHTHRHVVILDETTGKQTAFAIA